MSNHILTREKSQRSLPLHGWIGLGLILIFWILNWFLDGLRTQWAFFPLWLGYCLSVDGLVYLRKGTSLLTRGWRRYAGLFLVSAPVWWIFEAMNARLHNWIYRGSEFFTSAEYFFWATLSFTTVIPAVFGTSEFIGSFNFIRRFRNGPKVGSDWLTTTAFFLSGLAMLAAMIIQPKIFFPFAWLSLFFILEPINIWLGNRSVTEWTRIGDWRPIGALWTGVLVTAFFWEMWNFFSYPKWVYDVPWGNCCHIFEMPLLGYGGYLPFSLELFAVYHFMAGLIGEKRTDYVQVIRD
ncbi:MAG TPA: hypothetical protein VE136_07275 [Anaerolineales bacterium]|nr:hypothetical protein [Anaerolineales bacterium]